MNNMKKLKVYIAGPMRGIEYYNFPAFDMAAEALSRLGVESINPAQMDRDAGFDSCALKPDHDWSSTPPDFDKEACIKRDIEGIMDSDAILMLDGWWNSIGALAEYRVAIWRGIHIFNNVELVQDFIQKEVG